MAPAGVQAYGVPSNIQAWKRSMANPMGLFCRACRNSSLTTSRSVASFSWVRTRLAIRSASSHSASSSWEAGSFCQYTVTSELVKALEMPPIRWMRRACSSGGT